MTSNNQELSKFEWCVYLLVLLVIHGGGVLITEVLRTSQSVGGPCAPSPVSLCKKANLFHLFVCALGSHLTRVTVA